MARSRSRGWQRPVWPFGLPTKVCEDCNGGGAAPGALAEARDRKTDGGYSVVQRCPKCGGRGRLMDASHGKVCGHNLPIADCALCKRHL